MLPFVPYMDPMGNDKNPTETPYLMVKTMVSGVDYPIMVNNSG
jgi:hypothetical protein